jgi:formate hydrogenlyase subunit 3/multisubunit Na+/H+ antiporter MnhD subunit
VKLGVVPLHIWLPLAHPVAPVPASAVLSGLLVKAGLLGMLRFVPAEALPTQDALLAIGLFTAAFGAVVGLAQSRLKTVLAYSTVSQMGLAFAGLAAMHSGGAAPIAALGLFSLHHGLNKIALFLAAGHRMSGRLAWLLFLLPAASLAGLPFTSGALAKLALKDALDTAGAAPWLIGFSLSSVLTSVLLLHAFALARAQEKGRENAHPAWIGVVAAGVLLPWWIAPDTTRVYAFGLVPILDALWPLAVGAIVYVAVRRLRTKLHVPEGDLVVLMEAAAQRTAGAIAHLASAWVRWEPRAPDLRPDREQLRRIELQLGRLPIAGLCMLLILVGLALL